MTPFQPAKRSLTKTRHVDPLWSLSLLSAAVTLATCLGDVCAEDGTESANRWSHERA